MASRVANILQSLSSWALATVVVCACITGFYYFHRANEELRQRVQQVLTEQYPNHSITISSAHLVKGEGIRLRGLSVVQPATAGLQNRTELLYCEDVDLHCSPTMQQLLQGKVEIQHVRLRGLVLNPTREADGAWNFEDLLPRDSANRPLPTITLDDAKVELIDRRASPARVLSLENVQGALTPPAVGSADQSIALRATFTNHHLREVSVRAKIDPSSLSWSVQGTITDLRFTPELLRALPAEVLPPVDDLDGLRARADLSFAAAKATQNAKPQFAIQGKVLEGRFEIPRRLADPITEITVGSFHCDNAGWRFTDIRARHRSAQITVSARGTTQPATDVIQIWGQVDNLDITRGLVAALPDGMQNLWQKYQPLGRVDVRRLEAVRRDGRWWLETDVKCRNVSIVCEKFKYPLVRAQGTIHFKQHEKLTVDLWASADHTSEHTPIRIEADIVRPGPHFRGTVHVKSHDWLPLDRRISAALAPRVRKILKDMEAQGEITFDARLRRDEDTGDHIQRDILVDVRRGSLRYHTFPYPLERVRGRILVGPERWSFEDFVGHNDGCLVKCKGLWLPSRFAAVHQAGGQLRLDFIAQDIACDAELREALPAGPSQIWKSLRPTGTIDRAKIVLVHTSGMDRPEMDVVVEQRRRQNDPDRRSLVIQPTWFPLRMNQVTGDAVYNHDGTFQLMNLKAIHGSSQRSVDLQARGSGTFRRDGTWNVHLDRILADGVETTPELVAALPSSLRTAFGVLNFNGQLSVDGEMRIAGSSKPNSPIQSDWRSSITIDNGRFVLAGHTVESLQGQLSVAGRSDADGWRNAGRVNFDSLICRGVQITELDAPWQLDPEGLVFGIGATSHSTAHPPQRLRAKIFGGVAQAEGIVALGNDNQFRVDVELKDFNAADVANDLEMPSKITGRGDAGLQLSGSAQGTHTLSGRGSIRLRNANLARLPAIIALVNELRVRDAAPDVFSSSDIDFLVDGPYLNVDRFDLHGELLSLKGRGWVGFDRRINLAFYTILGGEQRWLQFVRPMLGQASQRFLQIRVTGSVDDARWSRTVLPGLFPDQARAPAADVAVSPR